MERFPARLGRRTLTNCSGPHPEWQGRLDYVVGYVILDFRLRDAPGRVDVSVLPNRDPQALGCPPSARDLPVCMATVSYEGRGYNAAFGWVQLVRSTDNESAGAEFELDPYEPLGPTTHPFCFFGFEPALFDAPARASRAEMDWVAESFLCFIPADSAAPETRAILGFRWGFEIRDQVVSLRPPESVDGASWDGHLPSLSGAHPSWTFAAGYRDR
jgi:hypothetical protein